MIRFVAFCPFQAEAWNRAAMTAQQDSALALANTLTSATTNGAVKLDLALDDAAPDCLVASPCFGVLKTYVSSYVTCCHS